MTSFNWDIPVFPVGKDSAAKKLKDFQYGADVHEKNMCVFIGPDLSWPAKIRNHVLDYTWSVKNKESENVCIGYSGELDQLWETLSFFPTAR